MQINIRGTSGSGKSTIVFTLLKKYPNVEVKENGKVIGYDVDAGLDKPIHVVGKYTTACGGLDGVPTQVEAATRALTARDRGCHVVMEGLLASGAGPKGAVTAMLHPTGDTIFAFLDTPLEVCIERVKQRRLARGDERPFNTTNTEVKFHQVVSTYKTLKKEGYKVALIDHTRAYDHVMEILRGAK